jgi:uncharacterized repeat protein (TIGR03803 family)
MMIALLTSAINSAQAQTFKVLHTFKGGPGDGYGPYGQLIRDSAGNLYGTTTAGGNGGGPCSGYGGCGTAFKLDKTGRTVWLHSFKFPIGWAPSAGLLRDQAGNLYGTTELGGDTSCYTDGCGTVFKLNKSGQEEVLYKFTGDPDGYFPVSLLVEDASGNLYGTASEGGAYGVGAVFELDASRKETVLYSFTGGSDGGNPNPGVILDAAGNMYGVTQYGGAGFGNSGYGVVFKLDTSGNETVLHTFGGGDGANPDSVLLFDSGGNLYGTTANGGSSVVCRGGCGTVFELSPNNGSWTETVLYSFCSLSGCADGETPGIAPLVRDAAGNIYGTTTFGGAHMWGTVFELDTVGKETVLHSFTGGADGATPVAGLVMDAAYNLCGTAAGGGDASCQPNGCGTVFRIVP